ncbi:MAG: hypothetical protein K0S53_3273 [Bacteroidetes bacterium]|jgi:GAF domain-containing protein|nr:hypothetical protein [Bacteroidota bacterium]MDF2451397.1 hypothetical protein [Bacteroidota bacterium]
MEKLQLLLEQVIGLEKADKGNIQIYNLLEGGLKIVAQAGFDDSFLKHFSWVKPFDTSACGRAFGIGITVAINDVEEDIAFKTNRQAAKDAGFRSVKSVPVFGKNDKCIGIVSTHFKEPKRNWETLNLTNILPEIALELELLQNKLNLVS